MNEMKLIEESITTLLAEKITTRKKSFVPALLTLIGGVAIIAVAYAAETLRDNPNLNSALLLAGTIVIIAALILLSTGRKQELVYAPTRQILKRRRKSFDATEREKVCDLVLRGDFAALDKMPSGNIAALQVVTYATPDRSVIAAQVQEYVPHRYVPVTESILFEK